MRRVFLLFTILTALAKSAFAAENTIYLQSEHIVIHPPSTWPIIAHKLNGAKDLAAFQIPNPADTGTSDSSNISVIAYDLKDDKSMLEFSRQLLDQGKTKHAVSEMDKWTIYTFSDKQNYTAYEIRDCYKAAD